MELSLQVIEASRRILSQDHPDTLAAMKNLAFIYFAQELRKEAQ
jgi:hypothetical protein